MNTQADLAAQYKSGMSQDYVNQLAKQYGVTPDQVYAIYANSATNPYMGGAATGQRDAQGSNTFGALSLLKTLGITGGGGQQQQQQGPTNIGGVSSSAKDLATNMGAAALGMNAIYNPTPQEASAISGVGNVAKATESNVVPSVAAGPWSTTPGVFTKAQPMTPTGQTPGPSLGQAQQYFVDQRAAAGLGQMKPGDVAADMARTYWAQMHPQAANAPSTSTPTPTPQATAAQVGAPTPFATAPAAPGIQIPQEAHTSALANAGMALFAHFGGDPNSASPEQINSFHSQLMNGIGGITASPGATALSPSAAPSTKEPVKMQYGGVVPGDPNDDTDSVSAKLSPGEVVIPKSKKRLTERPGPIQTATNPPPAAPGATTSNSGATGGSGSSTSSASGGYTGPTAANIRAQNAATIQGQQGWNAMGTGYSGGGGATVGDLMSGAATNPGAGQTQSLGQYSGAGSGMPTQQAGGVVSGLASGLASAAQAYEDSIKPWQVQASHIPNPDEFRNRYQTPTFAQSLV